MFSEFITNDQTKDSNQRLDSGLSSLKLFLPDSQ